MHPVLTRIATEKPDVIYAPVFVAAGAQLLRQEKETPGLEKVPLIGSSGQMAPDLIEAAGDCRRRLQDHLSRCFAAGDGLGLSEIRR